MEVVALRTIERVPVRSDRQPQHHLPRRELERPRHDTDDGEWSAINLDGLTQYAGFPAKIPLPYRAAQHRHGFAAYLLAVVEHTSQRGSYPHDGEEVGRRKSGLHR